MIQHLDDGVAVCNATAKSKVYDGILRLVNCIAVRDSSPISAIFVVDNSAGRPYTRGSREPLNLRDSIK